MMDEAYFFRLFNDFFDAERDAGKQHDISNYGLERMAPLVALAGHPEERLKIIHIAGTKGKGSTSHYIANLLHSAGYSVGLFTSPHLVTVCERFELNGEYISLDVLVKAAEKMTRQLHDAGLHPSLFEIFTVMALRIFADSGAEYAVMETGIGGLLDATNYVPRKECAVITPVSFDHVALLGHTIEEIAMQKAGIIAPNTPVILSRQPFDGARDVIAAEAARKQAKLIDVTRNESSIGWLPDNTPDFLKENFDTAMTVMACLGIKPVKEAFLIPELPARCQKICDDPIVILDAAHNEDSAKRLVEAIQKLYPSIHFTVVLGIVAGKDVAGIVRQLKKLDAEFILTNPQTTKGTAMPELEREAEAQKLSVKAVVSLLHHFSQLPENTPLLFTGSFFTCLIGHELVEETGKLSPRCGHSCQNRPL